MEAEGGGREAERHFVFLMFAGEHITASGLGAVVKLRMWEAEMLSAAKVISDVRYRSPLKGR